MPDRGNHLTLYLSRRFQGWLVPRTTGAPKNTLHSKATISPSKSVGDRMVGYGIDNRRGWISHVRSRQWAKKCPPMVVSQISSYATCQFLTETLCTSQCNIMLTIITYPRQKHFVICDGDLLEKLLEGERNQPLLPPQAQRLECMKGQQHHYRVYNVPHVEVQTS